MRVKKFSMQYSQSSIVALALENKSAIVDLSSVKEFLFLNDMVFMICRTTTSWMCVPLITHLCLLGVPHTSAPCRSTSEVGSSTSTSPPIPPHTKSSPGSKTFSGSIKQVHPIYVHHKRRSYCLSKSFFFLSCFDKGHFQTNRDRFGYTSYHERSSWFFNFNWKVFQKWSARFPGCNKAFQKAAKFLS